MGRTRGLVIGGLAAVAVAAVTVFGPAAHASPAIEVLPARTGLDPAGQTLTVKGSGFDPNANGGVGIYVVFGPKNSDYSTDAEPYQAAKWIRSAAFGGSGESELRADGSFEITLPDLKARYEDGRGELVDCFTVSCLVMTFTAHGVPDRSQDTFTPVSFDARKPAPVGKAVVPYRSSRTPAAPAGRPASGQPVPNGVPATPRAGEPTPVPSTAPTGEAREATAGATASAQPPPPIAIRSAGSGGFPGALGGVVLGGLTVGAGAVVAVRRRLRWPARTA